MDEGFEDMSLREAMNALATIIKEHLEAPKEKEDKEKLKGMGEHTENFEK